MMRGNISGIVNLKGHKSLFIIFIVLFAAIISTLQISAQTDTNQEISDLNYAQFNTSFEINKINPELQQIINEYPDRIVLVTILLKEQPAHSIAKKKQDKSKAKFHEYQDKVQDQFKGARKTGLAKNSEDINTYGSVEYDDETSIDIASPLTEIEKHNIIETNSKFEKARQEMILEILNETKEKIQPQQEKIINEIEKLDGSVEGTGAFYNVVYSRISARNIQKIADLPEVDSIEKTQISKPDMDTSSYSIFANTFWNNGLIGTSFEVGVADTGVDSSHPALSSRVIAAKDFVPGDSDGNNPDDLNRHGTHVSGTIASTDSFYRGIAHGANIINLKIGNSDIYYAAYDSDVMKGVDWAISGTSDPAEIISHSYGGNTGKSRFFDGVVDDLGLTVSVSAGNNGPNPQTVGYDSYNSIVVGAMDDKNTASRSDDTIASYSSRGPVTGTSRIKPDIMAPGSSIMSAFNNWEGLNSDFVSLSGTSMAAPHISGAAALLMSAGVYDPKEIKALLINTAEDKGATGGDYDYGWGYVDLNHTFFHTPDVRTGVVSSSNRYSLYKGYAFTGDKASLVWNRHVNYSGAYYPNIYHTLSDLDLYMYYESDSTLISSSISNDQNVEQVISNSNTNAVYKIQGYSFASGISSEEFAFATEEGFSQVNPPILNVSVVNPDTISSGANFNLDITVTNSGGIIAHGVLVTITLPGGFSVVSGASPQSIGSINAGSSKTASWVVKAPTVLVSTQYSLGGSTSSNSYDESYSGSGVNSISVGPRTITVDNSGGADYTKIQHAINHSNPGDTILVRSGTYYENVNMNKQLTLRGIGMPVVDAGGSGSAITLAADGITLEGFTATNATIGISVTSNNNMLIDNIASKNWGGPLSYGIYLSSSSNNTLIGNNANSNEAMESGTGISLYYASNNTLIGNNANLNRGDFGPGLGISLSYSNNNTLSNNNANSNVRGISLSSSSNNTLMSNKANSNYGNICDCNYDIGPGIGIFLSSSGNNTLIGNIASLNNGSIESDRSSIGGIGISLSSSSNNTLIGNNASLNNASGYSGLYYGYGIGISSFLSSNNLIYNNFFNNTNNLQFISSNANTWNITRKSGTNIIGGSSLGGNFWAHPDGTGFSQTCTDAEGDGMCDSAYALDGNNIDYLPLAKSGIIVNLIKNPGFEFGTANWSFYTNGTGAFSIISPGYEGNNAARLALSSGGTSIQLYQAGITLEPKTIYQLSFAAYSTTGHDMDVRLYQHVPPYADYGLNETFDLGTSWQTFTTEFISTNITNKVNDARLIFWLANFAAAGDTYYIDEVRLEKANAPKLPTITTQPLNQTVNVGQTATFTVVATGAALSYQWQKNGTNIPSATSASYKTSPTAILDNGSTYRVNVTNPGGSVLSNSATLTLVSIPIPPPTITTQPLNQTVNVGQTATFTVVATGTALSYQWQKNGTNIPGATSASYTTSPTAILDNGSTYRVNVTNAGGSVLSNLATLTVRTSVNTIKNGGFEYGKGNWTFYSNVAGTFNIVSPGYEGNNAAIIKLNSIGSNMQLYQYNIPMQPNTRYRLSFTARSTNGHDVIVKLIKHVGGTPYAPDFRPDLTTNWQTFSTEFISTSTAMNDARLMFWFVGVGAIAGEEYYFDSIILEKTTADPPTITTQPLNQTVNVGQTATFTVVATGTALSYQWQKNGTNIPGATSASYTTQPTTILDNGSTYRVNVTNTAGSVLSNSATLTVISSITPPTITTQPLNQTVNVGQTATFTVVATGTALSYQWQKNGTNIPSATSASYTTSPTTILDNGSTYRVNVTNPGGSAMSNSATLTLVSIPLPPPTITTQPLNQTVNVGQTATFSVVATGTALSYQWQKNGTNIPGATSASYTTSQTTILDNGSTYRVNVTNTAGSVLSNSATLIVKTSINVIKNGGFESGKDNWMFYSNGGWTWDIVSPGYEGNNANRLSFSSGGSNIQLYQTGVTLEPNTRYRLSFAAYSNTGHDVTVKLFKHVSPYTPYMPEYTPDLGTSWQTFTTEFNTTGLTSKVSDGRFQFWFAPFVKAGDVYYIDDIRLEKEIAPDLPTITTQPLNQTVNVGQTATFTVVATGTALSYQWQKNGTNIPSATSASYTTQPTTILDNGSTYRVNVTNTAGSVLSNSATLTLVSIPILPPTITTQPLNQTVNVGQTAIFSVVATGTALSYQWQKNGTNITGATDPSYTTSATILSDSSSTYRVLVTNPAGSTTSNAATLTVIPTSINLVKNPGFESGTALWALYTSGTGTFSVAPPSYEGNNSAKLAFGSSGSNIQFYQTGIKLEPNTLYRLSFVAYSTTGHDVTVRLFKHVSPYTAYMPDFTANLGTGWQVYTTTFTTTGFTGTVSDGRLQFWLAPFARAGDNYYIDEVRLEKI